MENKFILEGNEPFYDVTLERVEELYNKVYNCVFSSLEDFTKFISSEPNKKDILPIIEKFAFVIEEFSANKEIVKEKKRAIFYELLFAYLLPNRDFSSIEGDSNLTKNEKIEIINHYFELSDHTQQELTLTI